MISLHLYNNLTQ